MRDTFLLKVADVLEKTAEYLDGLESEKQAAVRQQRDAAAKDVATRYAEVTGEELDANALSKLAADDTALDTVRKMLDKTSGAVEAMGRPGRTDPNVVPVGRDQARQAAYDRFTTFLQN